MPTSKKSRHVGAQKSPEQFVPYIEVDDDGSIRITIVNPIGRSSNVYSYHTSTGKTEVVDKLKNGEWVGQINLSPSLEHRAWSAVKNFIESRFGLPGTFQELERLIESRIGIKKQWWMLGGGKDGKKPLYPVSLPNLLALMKKMEALPKDPSMAVIGNVTVAPHRQRQGFGLILHKMAALYLKQFGFKKMVSDLVGLNTTGEHAIWKKLRKDYSVVSFKTPIYPAFDMLVDANVIDKKFANKLNATSGFFMDGTVMSLKKMQKKQFLQFGLDLTDKRIPVQKA